MQPIFDFMSKNWGWILSVSGLIISLFVYTGTKIRALSMGVQALLRAQMIQDYNHYHEKGYAPLYARENFENCWIQYERLYKNGVMDDVHRKFFALPTHDDPHE